MARQGTLKPMLRVLKALDSEWRTARQIASRAEVAPARAIDLLRTLRNAELCTVKTEFGQHDTYRRAL